MKTLREIEEELKAMNFESEEELRDFLCYNWCAKERDKDWQLLKGGWSHNKAEYLWNKWQKEKSTISIEEVKEKYGVSGFADPTLEEQKQILRDFIDIASDEAIIKLYLTYAEIRGFEEETITKEEAEQRLKELTGSNYKIK